jgi:hypothetical protein
MTRASVKPLGRFEARPGRWWQTGEREPGPLTATQHRSMASARQLARLMDSRFGVGGVRFGLDPILGIVPGLGDAVASVASIHLLLVGLHLGVPGSKLARMALNIGVDFVFGLVPVLGRVTDLIFKANTRNLRILEAHVLDLERRHGSRGHDAG